jgi:hypothetical protein
MGKMFFVLTGIYYYMSEEHKLSPFFKRRIDHHKFEKLMRKGIIYMYLSKNIEQFKYKLVKVTLENYIYYKYNIDIEELPQDDVDNFIDYMIETYDSLLEMYYYNERKSRGNINENYSPAGKEITPNRIVIHKSSPVWRESILRIGLEVSAGDCYTTYVGYGEKCIPAIFATNSTNKRAWFDSTYDDDVWAINTNLIPNIKWYKDRHFESSKKHIVTFDNIPPEAIELIHEGTGKDWGLMESTNDDKLSKETMVGTFQDIVDETLEEIKNNCEELDADSFAAWLNFDTCDVVGSIDKISIVNIERKKGISRIPMFEVDVNLTFNSIFAWIDYDDFMYTIADRIIGKWKIRFIFNIKEQKNSNKREMWEYARTLKNARTQGSKLRFSKSAVKANPMRFRPYNR